MDKFYTAVAAEAAIPINLIQEIIAAIMTIIAGCNPTPAPTPAEVKTGSFRWGTTVYRGLFMVGVRPRSAQGTAIVASMEKNAALLSDSDASEFLTQCGVVPTPTPVPTPPAVHTEPAAMPPAA